MYVVGKVPHQDVRHAYSMIATPAMRQGVHRDRRLRRPWVCRPTPNPVRAGAAWVPRNAGKWATRRRRSSDRSGKLRVGYEGVRPRGLGRFALAILMLFVLSQMTIPVFMAVGTRAGLWGVLAAMSAAGLGLALVFSAIYDGPRPLARLLVHVHINRE